MAKTLNWIGGTGSWSVPGNWDGNAVPGLGDLAIDQNGHITATNVAISSSVLLANADFGAVLSLVNSGTRHKAQSPWRPVPQPACKTAS